MDSADHVVFVLQLIVTLGPLAVYFLGLGLVNSQAHPCLIRAGVDFVLLGVAFIPVIIAPVVGLIGHGHVLIASVVVMAVAMSFWAMLPRGQGSWVVYNIEPHQCRRLVERACRRLGWVTAVRDEQLLVEPVGLVVSQEDFPWLRNVTLRIHPVREGASIQDADRLAEALSGEVYRVSMLPSPTGASLVIIGASLLVVPIWYVFQNLNSIVDVVRRILFA